MYKILDNEAGGWDSKFGEDGASAGEIDGEMSDLSQYSDDFEQK